MAILNNNPLVGASGNQGGYNINNSLRFRASASAYLNRTFGSTYTDKTKSTVSFWVKRGSLNINNGHTIMWYNASGASGHITFAGSGAGGTLVNDCLNFSNRNATTGSGDYGFQTTQLFRDPSAWYHIIIVFDTGQATSTNRVKLYVNGTQVTAFVSTQYPSQNYQTTAFLGGNSAAHIIGYGATTGATEYFDGYLADFNFIDGQALTPSSFGETDTITGVWKPKAYTGTYGTNGFYLKFSDIATTSGSNAGLGKDFSGNSNYWTTNNISVTSGTTYDAMTDSPTNTSATVANYAVLNPLRSYSSVTISGANLNYSASFDGSSVATIGIDSGKYYWEATLTNANAAMIGLNKMTEALSGFVGSSSGSYGYFGTNGNKFNNNVSTAYGNSYTNGDVIGVAFDATNGKLFFSKNGTWQNSGDPAAGTNAAFTGLTGDTYVPAVGHGTMAAAINFGQRPFSYTPPTGYVALNTYNLPTPTILQGNQYMDATLYTGTGSSLNVTGVNFQPDFVWIKERVGAADHGLYDAVRGVQKQLESNTTTAETTETTGLTAFNSNGFTVGALAQLNTNTDTYVGWSWKANGAGSSNTSGSITSTVSVNTTAGFSVVTYTGTGANATVGHGLGVAPSMMIVKQRNQAQSWSVYHASLGATKRLYLDLTDAVETTTTAWNSTAPTSTVYSVGTSAATNSNGGTFVAYCWAAISGFSAFGSYEGNASSDGPMIYLGFRPKFVLIKRSSVAGNDWVIRDSSRDTYNTTNLNLYANLSDAEASGSVNIDFLSNGFKLRGSGVGANGSGTYIYAAFAESPFKNSLAR